MLTGRIGFLSSGTLVPVLQDLSVMATEIPGLGFTHVFGFMNLSFSVGGVCYRVRAGNLTLKSSLQALIGPIIAGQILNQRITRGWQIMCGISCALLVIGSVLAALYVGGPLTRQSFSLGAIKADMKAKADAQRTDTTSTPSATSTSSPEAAASQKPG